MTEKHIIKRKGKEKKVIEASFAVFTDDSNLYLVAYQSFDFFSVETILNGSGVLSV